MGYPAPLHPGVPSNNHDRRYDRRDAWVELSFRPETDYERALVGMAEPSTRAKWRALSECTEQYAQKVLDTADIVRDAIFRESTVASYLPGCRQGLSRWRGGRYRVVSPDISDTADVVWVTEKGDSRDSFTKNHVGRTPAPQLLCNHHAQLPAGRD